MKKNVGATDRLIRIILGLVIIAWGIYAENWIGLIGIIPFMTALLNWCPGYVPFKISTIKRGDNKG
jgi:Inner membrane protein YgaP-like, transmembrane domain